MREHTSGSFYGGAVEIGVMAEQRPRFRRDLVAKPVELEGVAYVETTDPRTGHAFRFYEIEHVVAQQFDGRPLPEVVPEARERSGLELTLEQLSAFAHRLTELGFLENHEPAAEATPQPGPEASVEGSPAATPAPTAEARPDADASADASPDATRLDDELDASDSVELVDEPVRVERVTAEHEAVASAEMPAADSAPPEAAPGAQPGTVEGPSITADVMEGQVVSADDDAPNALGPGSAPPAPAEPIARSAEPMEVSAEPETGTASSPPPDGTPERPLTEETAMPPVLPAGFAGDRHPAPASAPPAAAAHPRPVAGITPLLAPRPTPVTPAPRRRPAALYAALGIGAAAVMAVVVYKLFPAVENAPVTVHTTVPVQSSIFRFFDAVGTVKLAGERTLVFPAGGRVASIKPAGTTFKAGDVLAELEGARHWKAQLDHHRERLEFYEQSLETARTEGKKGEQRQAELKIPEKKRLMAEAQAGYAREAVIATGSGEIAEVLASVGAPVKAGAAAARTKGTDWRAELELSREDAERLRHLGFCHAEIDGKPLDCQLSPEGGDETHVLVDLPADPAVTAGKPVRVAKARYDGVYVLPTSALVPSAGSDRRVFVVKNGVAESYAVVLVDQTPSEIVVGQGLEPDSPVVVDVPPNLRSRTRVRAVSAN
jgi:multidrug efflux pump subunit AcrA (membrane-fusion protein)